MREGSSLVAWAVMMIPCWFAVRRIRPPRVALPWAVAIHALLAIPVSLGHIALMVGFRAHATSTALSLQDDEIESARWFTRAELVADLEAGVLAISGRLSIARRLIEEWFGGPIAAPEATLRR